MYIHGKNKNRPSAYCEKEQWKEWQIFAKNWKQLDENEERKRHGKRTKGKHRKCMSIDCDSIKNSSAILNFIKFQGFKGIYHVANAPHDKKNLFILARASATLENTWKHFCSEILRLQKYSSGWGVDEDNNAMLMVLKVWELNSLFENRNMFHTASCKAGGRKEDGELNIRENRHFSLFYSVFNTFRSEITGRFAFLFIQQIAIYFQLQRLLGRWRGWQKMLRWRYVDGGLLELLER